MTQKSSRYPIAVLLTLLLTGPSWAQKSGGGTGASGPGTGSPVSGPVSSGPTAPSQPTGSVSGANGQQPGMNQPQFQAPLFVNGQILMENGKPVPEPVSVALGCGIQSLQTIHTDLKGYFQFTLGAGTQSNMDYSASSDAPVSPGGGRMSFPSGGLGGSASMLTGCEVRVSVPGYQPLTKTITDRADMTGIELGALHLTRLAGVDGFFHQCYFHAGAQRRAQGIRKGRQGHSK